MLTKYHPEIEARRKDYQQLAESLIQMCELQSQRASEVLDVEAPGWLSNEPENYILWDAIQDHLHALFENIAMTFTDDFLRTLYVELRLFYDQQMFAGGAGGFRSVPKRSKRKGTA